MRLSTNRIARAAGVSVGTLYQYFPDKLAVLVELSRENRAARVRGLQRALEESEALALGPALARLVRAGLEPELTRPALAIALDHEEEALALYETENALALERLLATFLARYYHGNGKVLSIAAHEVRVTAQLLAELAAARGAIDTEALVHKISGTLLALLDASLTRRREAGAVLG